MKSVFRTGYLIRQILTPLLLFALAIFFIVVGNTMHEGIAYGFSGIVTLGGLIFTLRFIGWNYFVVELTEEKLKVIYPLAGRVFIRKYSAIKRINGNRRSLGGEGLVLTTKGGGGFNVFRNLDLYFKDGEEISFSEDHYENFNELRDFLLKQKRES